MVSTIRGALLLLIGVQLSAAHSQPKGFWLFNDKYDTPYLDVSGNGHDATPINIHLQEDFPRTDYKTAHFGNENKNAIIVAKDDDFTMKSFTVVVYVKPDRYAADLIRPILLWDPVVPMQSTSIWVEMGGIVYVRIIDYRGKLINQNAMMGLHSGRWSRVIVAYNHINGQIAIGINNKYNVKMPESSVVNAEPKTNYNISFGYTTSIDQDKTFIGSLSCAYIFNEFIHPKDLDWATYHARCFDTPEPTKALNGACQAAGSLHYNQFDGNVVHYQGTCSYIFARDGCKDGVARGIPSWMVVINPTRGHGANKIASVSEVFLVFPALNTTVTLLKSRWAVNVDDKRIPSVPYIVNQHIRLEATLTKMIVITDIGVEVLWDGNNFLKVIVDGDYIEDTCGVCGTYDAINSNDRIVGPNDVCMEDFPAARPGQPTSDDEAFVSSWTMVVDPDDESCVSECGQSIPDPTCSEAHEIHASELCHQLRDDEGVFKSCLDAMKEEGESYYIQTYQSCVFDSCAMNDFRHELLCKYAQVLDDICRNDYDVIVNYRGNLKCPVTCPEGSTYTPCGSICEEPTCNHPNGTCRDHELAVCEEMCICRQGYVMLDGQCIRKELCGCQYGVGAAIVPVGESVVRGDCQERCTCQGPGQELQCEAMSCSSEQTCDTIKGLTECFCPDGSIAADGVCIKPGLCRCSGDPHCVSFDGRASDFQGNCKHIIAQDNCKNGMPEETPTWVLAVDNWRRGKRKPVSWVKEVILLTAGTTIKLRQGGEVMIDGVLSTLPIQFASGVRVFDMPNYVWITTDFGLTVMWDRTFSVRVLVDPKYKHKVCGMCGDFNGDPSNDYTVGPNAMECREHLTDKSAKPGMQTNDLSHFGYSWLFGRDDDDCECRESRLTPTPDCTPEEKVAAQQECLVLKQADGPLQTCLKVMSRKKVIQIDQECVYDLCHVTLNVSATVCDFATELELNCAQQHNLNVKWRHPDFCALDCPANSQYTTCMPVCMATCDDPDGSKCEESIVNCVEGCMCDKGYVFYNGQCVHPSNCGCTNNYTGSMVKLGESVLTEDCSQRCTCPRPGSEVECVDHSCGELEVCHVDGGIRQCSCKTGFSRVKGECVPNALCRCSGDPHCYSFDARPNSFQGGCKYVLARDRCRAGVPNGEPRWLVAVDNWRKKKGKPVTWVKSVTVLFEEHKIELGQGGLVIINGVEAALPFQLTPVVLVHDMPNYVWVSTEVGLIVMWDRKFSVRVQITPGYAEHVCGMCGDYNGDPDNDFIVGPNEDQCMEHLTDAGAIAGDQTDDERHFGFSWLYENDDEDCNCKETSAGSGCTPARKAQARIDCSMLKTKNGPLKDCLAKLDDDEALTIWGNCVFDLCEVDLNATEILCDYAQQIVLSCQEKFDMITDWRSPSFCPAKCEENAHYERCASPCVPSCADPDNENCIHTAHCVEGCVCDKGFLLSNGQCIRPQDCGCVELTSGAVVGVGRTIVLNNCTKRCSCDEAGMPATCVRHQCSAHQECINDNGRERCSCVDGYQFHDGACRGAAVCSCSGDPHCSQFDGGHVSFHGSCKYTLARDGCTGGLPYTDPTFEVLINNQRVNPDKLVSKVEDVTVVLANYDLVIWLKPQGIVKVDGKVIKLPAQPHRDVRIFDTPDYVHVTSKVNGLKVQWNRKGSVRVTISPQYFDKTCGICGVYDAFAGGDMVVGPSIQCMDSFTSDVGQLTDSEVLLGTSWLHSLDEEDAFCVEDCEVPPNPIPCSQAEQAEATKACEILTDPFKKCIEVMGQKLAARTMVECIFDVCSTGQTEKYVCISGSNWATTCAEKYNVYVDWRSPDLCPADCPVGAEYSTCGPVCQPTCDDLDASQCLKLGSCQPGCFCKEGLVFNGKECVTSNRCYEPLYPCNDQIHPITGETYDARVECFTCKNVDNDEECYEKGSFQTCMIPQAICEYTRNVQKKGGLVKVNRKCTSRPDCPKGSLGQTACGPVNKNILACTQCFYGDIVPNEPRAPVYRCKSPVSRDDCYLPKDPGTASGQEMIRYYFSEDKCECLPFPFRGVGGNANNFPTIEACEGVCETWDMPDECSLTMDPGPCSDFMDMYYYNKAEKLCMRFKYGGCEGTANRFATKLDCRNACKRC